VHLAREHCSAGVGVDAWCLRMLSSVSIAAHAHAFAVLDPVFIRFKVVSSVASSCWRGAMKDGLLPDPRRAHVSMAFDGRRRLELSAGGT
jgi:hypothetical protein